MQSPTSVFSAWAALRQRFSGRLDTEHEQALVRLVIGVVVFFYFLLFPFGSSADDISRQMNFAWVMVGFTLVSVGLLIHIACYPEISPARRFAAIVLDIGAVTYFFFYADEHALPLYFLYLWIIFGYGFRFGRRYLLITLALSLIGFGAAIFSLTYWLNNQFLGVGLWLGMLLVSLYVNTLVGRLTAALSHAEAANQAKRRFISSVSHELRTPLNAIIGMTDLLRTTMLSRDQQDMVRSLDSASHAMLSLIEDVLDFSKIEAGKLVIENTEFDIHELINNTVDIFRYHASENGLRLIVHIDPSVPHALYGDPHHLRQVLVNFLSNAMKFTKEGHVVLRIDSLVDSVESIQLRFEVEDTGIGISTEAQEKVFDSFTQADDSTTRRYGGTGLGTTISKQLIELMGGKLGLQSRLGVGSLFWFEVDFKKQSLAVDFQGFSGLRILLIGFFEAEVLPISEMLRSWSISFDRAPDIESAVDVLRDAVTSGHPYQIALLNGTLVKVAKLSGQRTEMFLKESIENLHRGIAAELPVILFSADGLGGRNANEIAEETGLAAILNFPIEKRYLFNAIHAASAAASMYPETDSRTKEYRNEDQVRSQYSILVAEDNPTNSKVIQKILERAGHYCTLVKNGEEALDQLGQHDFDVVVFDMNMPVMGGVDATKAYRFMRPAEMRAPIIIFSADVTTDAKEECMKAGVDEFLAKPIQVNAFLETLDRLVDKFGSHSMRRISSEAPAITPILVQPQGVSVILNYATLAELEHIGQDRMFVDGLLAGFIQDNQKLMEKLEISLLVRRFEEFNETLHAIKGSSASIGAASLRTTCHHLEGMTRKELEQHPNEALSTIKHAFTELCEALEHYRKKRVQ
jgi:two-component system sensor histidine kinase RpfC